MTNFGKCETCRSRKVKCDEAWPKCGACRKKGRECHYTNTRDSIFVHEKVETIKQEQITADSSASTPESTTSVARAARRIKLHVKRSRKAEDGVGEYHTLGQIKSSRHPTRSTQYSEAILAVYSNPNDHRSRFQTPSPQPIMACPQTQLAAEWSSIFGFEALQLNPLGTWVKSTWLHRGENTCLDLASDYALESMRAFRRQDQIATSRAWVKAQKALQSLQVTMQSNKKANPEYLIFAVMLHCAAEQFVDISSFYYVPHVFGIAELLKTCLEKGLCSEAIRNVISLICFDEVNLSITFTRSSALEGVPIPYIPIDGPYELDLALLASDYVLIKVPRLVGLVRNAAQQPENTHYRLEAAKQVKEWYKPIANTYIEKTLEEHMWTVDCSKYLTRSPDGNCFEFASLAAFGLAVRHYAYRILMSGLMQTVANFMPEAFHSDAIAAQQEDISASISLGMCLKYALKPSEAMPITALGLVMPLQIANAAWYRLKNRTYATDPVEYQRAVRMKDFNMDCIHVLEAVWCDKTCNHARMDENAEMYAGGIPLLYAYNYRRCPADPMDTTVKAGVFAGSEYQWELDLSASLNGLALSDSQKLASTAVPTTSGPSRGQSRSKKKAIETITQLDSFEVSSISTGASSAAASSASALEPDRVDGQALMSAWGYPSAGLQHFRQS